MIFLSFSSEDRDAARCLAAGLTAAEVAVWCTAIPGTIAKGRRPEMEVPAAIARCSAFAVLAVRTEFSHWVLDEIAAARRRLRKEPEFPLVPLLGPDVDPAALPITITNFEGLRLPADPRKMRAEHFAALARELGELASHLDRVVEHGGTFSGPSGGAPPRRAGVAPKLEMVRAPAGLFFMGSARSAHDDERPHHKVGVGAFEIAKHPVTRELWRAVMGDAPPNASWARFRRHEDLPATEMTWSEAREFCAKLSAREGLEGKAGYRLPSEAEWEYACRAGTSTEYWSGSSSKDLDRVGWFDENSSGALHPVGEKPANPWGLFDVHGNVWEWCEDVWHPNYVGAPNDGRAWEGALDQWSVIRGGSVESSAEFARSAFRVRYDRRNRARDVGLRPARSISKS